MKKISLCNLHIPLDVVELTFTISRSRSCLKIKFFTSLQNNINLKSKKILRPEQDSNPACPALKSSTPAITLQSTSEFLKHYSPINS